MENKVPNQYGQKFIKQKTTKRRPAFKTKQHIVTSRTHNSSRSINNSTKKSQINAEISSLRTNNRDLAITVNHYKTHTHNLTERINRLQELNLQLRTELAELRRNIVKFTQDGRSEEHLSEVYGANGSFHAANLEHEYQKRLVAFLEPLKTSLYQGLESVNSLTENLTNAMSIATAPARRSKSLGVINFSRDSDVINNNATSSSTVAKSLAGPTTPTPIITSNLSPLQNEIERESFFRVQNNQLLYFDAITEENDQSITSKRKSSLKSRRGRSSILNFEGIIQSDNQNLSEPLSCTSLNKPDTTTNSINMTLERENAKDSSQLEHSSMNIREKSNSTPLSPENETEKITLNVDNSSINKESPRNEKAKANLSLQDSLTNADRSTESIVLTPENSLDKTSPLIGKEIPRLENAKENMYLGHFQINIERRSGSFLHSSPRNENDQNTDNMIEKSPSENKDILKSISEPNLVIDNSQDQIVIGADDENKCSSMLQVKSSASGRKAKKGGTIKKQNSIQNTFSESTLARPKRRAVTMITNFKEPSLGKKLRR